MVTPEPYKPAEGAAIYRLCDVPVGWEHRDGEGFMWQEKRAENRSPVLVEARPKPEELVTLRLPRRLVESVADHGQFMRMGDAHKVSEACVAALKGDEL